MKKTKTALLATTVLALGGLAAGCGSSTSSNNAATSNAGSGSAPNGVVDYSKASGTIVWAAPPITHTGLRKALIAKFEAEHPNITVQLQSQADSTDTNRGSLTTAIGGGSATPDVYMGDVVWPAQFANSQLAMPLNSVLPSSFWGRFASGLVDGATYKGKIYAVPFFADSAFLFYRKDLLQKAGLPVPTTWEQVEQEGKTLQQKGLVKYGFVWQGASYEGLTCDFSEYLADAGGSVLDKNGQVTLDTPQAQKALSFMRDLIQSGVSPKAEVTFQENESMNTFNNGDAAFLRNWTYAYTNSNTGNDTKVAGEVGVVPLPTFQGQTNNYSCVGGWDLYVNPHTKNLAATLAFMDWMSGPEAQHILAANYGELPVNAQVQQDPSVQKLSPVFGILSKTHFVSRPVQNPNYPQISQAIYTNVNQALSGGTSVENALKQAQQQVQQAVGSNGGL